MSAPVLVAYDPARRDRAPVFFGAALAASTGAPLFVASVFAGEEAVKPLAAAQMGEDLPADADQALAELLRDLDRTRLETDTIAAGATSVPRALDLAAVEVGAGVVVVGSAAAAPEDRVAPGSTAARLLSGAPSAVALVPAGWRARHPFATFDVGFADGPEGQTAVRVAHALARRAGTALRVLTTVRPPPPRHAAANDRDIRALAEQAAAAATPTTPGVRVDIDVTVGDPAETLVGASATADLLVCGARCYGPAPAVLLGGVTRTVTTQATCPVVVLARSPAVELDALVA